MAKEIREKLRMTIEQIPENKLGELLDFMEFIVGKTRHTKGAKLDLDPGKDPILKYIGGVSHGSLAKNIDGELYGEKV
jgi:hypothetical protein